MNVTEKVQALESLLERIRTNAAKPRAEIVARATPPAAAGMVRTDELDDMDMMEDNDPTIPPAAGVATPPVRVPRAPLPALESEEETTVVRAAFIDLDEPDADSRSSEPVVQFADEEVELDVDFDDELIFDEETSAGDLDEVIAREQAQAAEERAREEEKQRAAERVAAREAMFKAEQARRDAEEAHRQELDRQEAERKAAEEAAAKKAADEAAAQKAADEAAAQKAADEAAAKKAAEEAAAQKAADEAAAQKAAEEEAKKKEAEQKAADEAAARQAAEAESAPISSRQKRDDTRPVEDTFSELEEEKAPESGEVKSERKPAVAAEAAPTTWDEPTQAPETERRPSEVEVRLLDQRQDVAPLVIRRSGAAAAQVTTFVAAAQRPSPQSFGELLDESLSLTPPRT